MAKIIKINEIYPNPESGSEWIEFLIDEEAAENLDLANYTVFDSYHQIYKFTTEQFNSQLLVVEVSGLNNDQDSVVLKDVSGNILDSFSYISTEKGLSWAREPETNNFLLSEATPGQINPTPTPTTSPTPTLTPTLTSPIATTPTSSPTVIPITSSPSPTQTNTSTSKTYSYDLSKVKLRTEEKSPTDRSTRLVILGRNQGQTEIVNAIIGSAVIILSSLYLLYVKRKSKQN